MNPQEVKAPDKTITLKVGEEDREIFMSYGLQDQLLRLIPDTHLVGTVYTDSNVRNAVIEQVLADRSKTGKIILQRSFDEYEIELEEVEKLLGWVVDHVTAFFVRVINQLESKIVPIPEIPVETPSTPS